MVERMYHEYMTIYEYKAKQIRLYLSGDILPETESVFHGDMIC